MPNNILLNAPQARFESHLWADQELPFRYHRATVKKQMVLNIHENLELLFFLEGEGSVTFNGETCPVRQGDLAVVNCYVSHQVRTDGHLKEFCLIIDNGFCRYNGIDPTALSFENVVRDETIGTLMEQVMEACYEPDAFRNIAIKSGVLAVLLHLCRHYSVSRQQSLSTGDPALGYVCQAAAFIKENLSQPLSADRVAAHVGLSKYHFLREFKRITGHTLVHYINALRCGQAQRLLEQGDCKVKEAASLCGFSNHSYFTKVFRQHTGQYPSRILPE